jgi:hypothetical protein
LRLEVALPLGAVALYLYDCLLLMFDNEYLFTRSLRAWRASAGSAIVVFGRRVLLLNPLLPHRPVFRVAVSSADFRDEAAADHDLPDSDAFRRAVLPLQVIVQAQLIILFVVLPASLGTFGPDWISVAVVGIFYALTLVALIWAGIRRDCLGLDGKTLALLWSDGMLCAPFAVNLVRKISLHWKLGPSAIRFAKDRFQRPAFAAFAQLLCSRLAAMLDAEPENSPRRAQILGQLQRIGELAQ